MTDTITIPPVALEALPSLPEPYQKEILASSKNTNSVREGYEVGGYVKVPALYTKEQVLDYARAACLAMLNAWPKGAVHMPFEKWGPRPAVTLPAIILPLQEPTDDR